MLNRSILSGRSYVISRNVGFVFYGTHKIVKWKTASRKIALYPNSKRNSYPSPEDILLGDNRPRRGGGNFSATVFYDPKNLINVLVLWNLIFLMFLGLCLQLSYHEDNFWPEKFRYLLLNKL